LLANNAIINTHSDLRTTRCKWPSYPVDNYHCAAAFVGIFRDAEMNPILIKAIFVSLYCVIRKIFSKEVAILFFGIGNMQRLFNKRRKCGCCLVANLQRNTKDYGLPLYRLSI